MIPTPTITRKINNILDFIAGFSTKLSLSEIVMEAFLLIVGRLKMEKLERHTLAANTVSVKAR